MAKNKRQSFQQGAIILSLAAVLTKIIGALFKIPIQREEIAGITGFGYFATAYDIYLPVYTIAIAGFPIAVSRMVSASVSLRRYRDVQVIYRVARKVFFVTGTVGALVMLGAAFVYPGFVGIPGSFWPMVMMAPAVFFCCMVSAHRGLYEGLRNMTPTAVSQVIEALGKLVLGLGLAVGALRWGQWQYAQGKPVFGTMASSAAHARELSLPFIAAGAMLGVTAGSFFALVYMVIRHHRLGTGITKEELAAAPVPDSSRTVFRELMRIAVPVAMGALATQLTNLIDVASLQRCLKTVLEQHGDVLRGMYEPWLTASGTKDILSWLIGGRGTAMTYVNLIPNITLTFGISALPVITSAWAVKNRERLVRTVESVIRLTLLVALPASIGLAVLAKPIIFLIYGQQHVAALVGPLLAVLGAAVVFICFTGPINAMLQAVGRADIPMKIILAGGLIKLGLNVILVLQPRINIMGSAYSTLVCYVFMVTASLFSLKKATGVRLRIGRVFLRPLTAALCCGAAAWAANGLLGRVISVKAATVAAIGLAALVYLAVLLLVRAFTKEDILSLPKGEKIAQTLEKRGWIG